MSIKVINWESQSGLQEWKVIAEEKQMFYYQLFKSIRWQCYMKNESIYLKTKIGYAFFGPPVGTQDSSIENFYNLSQKNKIEEIFLAVKKVTGNADIISLGFLYLIAIIGTEYMEFPMLRVLNTIQKGGEDYEIIDSYGCAYKSWETFINTNSFPYGIYCYPKRGFYSCDNMGKIEIGFRNFTGASLIITELASFSSKDESSKKYSLSVPCSSTISGTSRVTKHYSIPVSSVYGSAEVYAVHSTHLLAKNSQCMENIPQTIAEALEFGFIKPNWFSVFNNAQNQIQNENNITDMHISSLIASTLFFCNSVLTRELTKSILNDIKTNFNTNLLINQKKKILLEKSLMFDGKLFLTKSLKFIDDKSVVLSEMIDKHFRTDITVTNKFGKYFKIGEWLDHLETPSGKKKCIDILTNYCIVLEETVRHCDDCKKIIGDKFFTDKLHHASDNIMSEENVFNNNLESVPLLNKSKRDSTLKPLSPSVIANSIHLRSFKKNNLKTSNWLLDEIYNKYYLLISPNQRFLKEEHFSDFLAYSPQNNSTPPLVENNLLGPHTYRGEVTISDTNLNYSEGGLINSSSNESTKSSQNYDLGKESWDSVKIGFDKNNNKNDKMELDPQISKMCYGSKFTLSPHKGKPREKNQSQQHFNHLAREIIPLKSSPLNSDNIIKDICLSRCKEELQGKMFTDSGSVSLETKTKQDRKYHLNHLPFVKQRKLSSNHTNKTDGKNINSSKNCNKYVENFLQTTSLQRAIRRSQRGFAKKDAKNVFQHTIFVKEHMKKEGSKFKFFGLLLIIITPSFLQLLGSTVKLLYY